MPRHLTLTFTDTEDRSAFVKAMTTIGVGDLRVDDQGKGPLGLCVHQRDAESAAQSASRLVRWVEEVRGHAELDDDTFKSWVGANPEQSYQGFPGYNAHSVGAC